VVLRMSDVVRFSPMRSYFPSRVLVTSVGNSLDELRHPRSVANSVELVLLNKHQILGGGAHLDCYPQDFRT